MQHFINWLPLTVYRD